LNVLTEQLRLKTVSEREGGEKVSERLERETERVREGERGRGKQKPGTERDVDRLKGREREREVTCDK
jgi:hypothetical protein